jgi:hypothetical protein
MPPELELPELEFEEESPDGVERSVVVPPPLDVGSVEPAVG